MGAGIFNAPNAVAGMMSIAAHERGVASAVRMLTMMVRAGIGK